MALCTVQDVVDASLLWLKAAPPAACACSSAMQPPPCSQQPVCALLPGADSPLPKQLPGADSPLPKQLPGCGSLHAPFYVVTDHFICKETIPALITTSPIGKAEVSTAPILLPHSWTDLQCHKTPLCLCDVFAPAKNGRHVNARAHTAMQEDPVNDNCSEISSCWPHQQH